MHIPKIFEQKDSVHFRELINSYPFATLISNSASGLEANHIPLLLNQSNGKDVLQGHIAKVNSLWKTVEDKSEVLVVFNGPNCYISPNYYPTKIETGKVVPTWNYVVVHVKGTMSYIHDDEWNLNMINNLTSRHEYSQPKPWSVADAPDKYINRMLPAIVGLEIEISSITGQWKASQNQPERNQLGVMNGLMQESKEDSLKIAKIIEDYAV